jgi:hypothetical protein
MAGIGCTRRLYQVKYLSKDAPDYDRGFKLGVLKGYKSLFNIIKHECSHFAKRC